LFTVIAPLKVLESNGIILLEFKNAAKEVIKRPPRLTSNSYIKRV
jgi:hypothetical protein